MKTTTTESNQQDLDELEELYKYDPDEPWWNR